MASTTLASTSGGSGGGGGGAMQRERNIVEGRVSKVLGVRAEGGRILDSLEAISSFYGKQQQQRKAEERKEVEVERKQGDELVGSRANSLEDRRALRSDLEEMNLALLSRFLSSMEGAVVSEIGELHQHAKTLHESAASLHQSISSSRTALSSFVKESQELSASKAALMSSSRAISSFLDRFSLSEAEEEVLALGLAPVTGPGGASLGPFFRVLARVNRGIREIKILCKTGGAVAASGGGAGSVGSALGVHPHYAQVDPTASRTGLIGGGGQRVGFELLEALSVHQEKAYTRLFDFVTESYNDQQYLVPLAFPRSVLYDEEDDNEDGDDGARETKASARADAGLGGEEDRARAEEDEEVKETEKEKANITISSLALALQLLKRDRPVLFEECVSVVQEGRRRTVIQGFIRALLRGGSGDSAMGSGSSMDSGGSGGGGRGGDGSGDGGSGGPDRRGSGGDVGLDVRSYEPVRYTGDMLAWVHQTIASEQELLVSLFSAGSPQTVRGMLCHVMTGVSRSLKARIVQVVSDKLLLATRYTVTDLLLFYLDTFDQLLGPPPANALHDLLHEALTLAQKQLNKALEDQEQSLLSNPPAPSIDLSPPSMTHEMIRVACEALAAHGRALYMSMPPDTGAAQAENAGTERAKASATKDAEEVDETLAAVVKEQQASLERIVALMKINTILDRCIRPLLQMCRVGAVDLDSSDQAVYMLNNALAVKNALTQFYAQTHSMRTSSTRSMPEPVAQWLETFSDEINTWSVVLVSHETQRAFRKYSSYDEALHSIRQLHEAASAGVSSDTVSTDALELAASAAAGVASESSLDLDSPALQRLQSTTLREDLRRAISANLADAYQLVYSHIAGARTGVDGEALRRVFVHTPAQVRVLLDCE